MSDHKYDDHAVEDLDVPEADAENVTGGAVLGKKLEPVRGVKIDFARSADYGWEA